MNKEQTLTSQQKNELGQLFKQKKYNVLLAKCESYIKNVAPTEPLIYLLKGIALRETKLYDESHKAYLEGIKVFPENIDLLNDLSHLLILKKDYKNAENILKKLIDKDENNQVAKKNLAALKSLIDKEKDYKDKKLQMHEASRSLSPLRSAFNPSEVKESRENLKKVKKIKLEKKLNKLPALPTIDKEVLAEEWISAGKDALGSKYPEFALKCCSFAIANNGNTCQIYGLAADTYISIKQYIHAHLCYLIAAEHGELDSQQEINLLSLAAMIGDNNILARRREKLETRISEKSNPRKTVEKIITSLPKDSSTIFDPKYGIISSKDLMKTQNAKGNS